MAGRKPSLKGALKRSMDEEQETIDRRFARAEQALGDRPTLTSVPESETNTLAESSPPVGKVVRDSFTMPQEDHDLIQLLRDRCLKSGVSTSKSELVRAGLRLLRDMNERELLTTIQAVEKVRTGRPKR